MRTIETMRWDVVYRLVSAEVSLQRIMLLIDDERLLDILADATKKLMEVENSIAPQAEERPVMVHIMEEYERDE